MSDFVIYFNPKCSKCRIALQALNDNGAEPQVIQYLDTPPDRTTMGEIMDMLTVPVSDMVRKDQNFANLGLNEEDYNDRESVTDLLEKHPELMQRPIVVQNGRAIIARTPESIDEILES